MKPTRAGSSGQNLVHRGQNGGKSRLDFLPHAGMGENVEFILANGLQHARSDGSGIEPRPDLSRDLGHHGRRRTGGIERLRLAVTLRSVAPALADAGADKARAQDAYADAEWLELQGPSDMLTTANLLAA
jgi:hypothetical protein